MGMLSHLNSRLSDLEKENNRLRLELEKSIVMIHENEMLKQKITVVSQEIERLLKGA